MTAHMEDLATRNSNKVEIKRSASSLTKAEVQDLKEEARTHKDDDKQEVKRLGERNKIIATIFNIQYKLRTEEKLKALCEETRTNTEQKCSEVEQWLRENPNASFEEFKLKRDGLLSDWSAVSNDTSLHLSTGM